MPILRREPDAWPETIFDSTPDEMPWHVAYLRSRQEKNLARQLRGRVPFYLPQWEQRRRRGKRTLVAWLPLFSGYLFFRGSVAEKKVALGSNLIVSLLEVADQGALQDELSQLYRLQASGGILEPWPNLREGDHVVIRCGPFEGYRGVLVSEKERMRLVVSVKTLRQSVSVELSRDSIRPASSMESRSTASVG